MVGLPRLPARRVAGEGSLDVCLGGSRTGVINSQSVSAMHFLSETLAQPVSHFSELLFHLESVPPWLGFNYPELFHVHPV